MNQQDELLDFDTYVAVRKAAPKVTGVSFGNAMRVVNYFIEISKTHLADEDGDGQIYWQESLKEIARGAGIDLKLAGRACREFGLTMWRKTDGYHVAWSDEQLGILRKYFQA